MNRRFARTVSASLAIATAALALPSPAAAAFVAAVAKAGAGSEGCVGAKARAIPGPRGLAAVA